MLILAGVSLNAIVGENGIITMAQKAKSASEKAGIIEAIENKLMEYNISLIADDSRTNAKTAIDRLLSGKIIDAAMSSDGTFSTDTSNLAAIPLTNEEGSWLGEFEYVVEKSGYRFNVYQDRDGTYTVGESDIVTGETATGGNVTGGKTLVTSDAFTANDEEGTNDSEKGKYTIVGDASVIFADKINGSFSIHVAGTNVTATVSIFDDMTLSNSGLARSAIDIDPTCTLNLWIAEGAKVTVDSGYGSEGVYSGAAQVGAAWGGNGGYAGIHVPSYDVATTYATEYEKDENGNYVIDSTTGYRKVASSITYQPGKATLNLSGSGTLICIGGNAGNGGGTANALKGGGRRWPELELELVATVELAEKEVQMLL